MTLVAVWFNSCKDRNHLRKETVLTVEDILKELEALGTEKTRIQNSKQGAGENQFGVRLGELRKLAKKIKSNHALALKLWNTENIDARFLAILLMDPKALSSNEMDKIVRSVDFDRVADWLNSYIVKKHPEKELLREKWMSSDDPMAARSGWSLTTDRVVKRPEGLDISALLDRLETEMGDAPPEAQWTMNFALAHIGIHIPGQRERAIKIGEKLGLYRDYPVSKGCTSPFAPIWIKTMVNRQ